MHKVIILFKKFRKLKELHGTDPTPQGVPRYSLTFPEISWGRYKYQSKEMSDDGNVVTYEFQEMTGHFVE